MDKRYLLSKGEIVSTKEAVGKLENLLKVIKLPRKPFGIFLSGGLDSSLLAYLYKPDIAFTTFADQENCNELEWAKTITNDLKMKLVPIHLDKNLFKKELPKMIRIMKCGFGNLGNFPAYMLCKTASENNISEIVTGDGADELFAGYARYLIQKHIWELYNIPELKNYYFLIDKLNVLKGEPKKQTIAEMGYCERDNLLQDIEMKKQFADYFKIKLITPFLDPDIIEFAVRLPDKLKIKGWTTKIILRELGKKYFPKKYQKRKDKIGMWSPATLWLGLKEFDNKKYAQRLNHYKVACDKSDTAKIHIRERMGTSILPGQKKDSRNVGWFAKLSRGR